MVISLKSNLIHNIVDLLRIEQPWSLSVGQFSQNSRLNQFVDIVFCGAICNAKSNLR